MRTLDRPQIYDIPRTRASLSLWELERRHARGIARALAVAETSSHRFPMSAVAFRGGTLIGTGVNRFRNHPRVVDNWQDCSVHAEIDLARSSDLAGSTIYVARLHRTGVPALAKPCKNCWETLQDTGVRQIFWTIDARTVGTH